MPGPNAACVLVVAGILGIYAECIWPGRILPGVLGSAALIAGAYWFYRLSPAHLGLGLIAGAVALFGAEAFWDAYFLFGICATGALAAGLALLFDPPHRIFLALAIASAVILGTITIFLAQAAKRARRNKSSDVGA
jgi:membrane-bound serine protease (ClpP class)